jgi:hypothetical protein
MIGDIKMDMKGIGYECVDWIHLGLDWNPREFGREPSSSAKGREFLAQLSEC